MSDPTSNLRKNKKTPLPGVKHGHGQRAVPFRATPSDLLAPSELDDLDDVLTRTVSRLSTTVTSKNDLGSLPSQKASHLPRITPRDKKNPPTDMDLMNSMMSRIAKLEIQVKYYAKEIIEKDKRIAILEEKLTLMKKYQGEPDVESQRVKNLERKCQCLQEQIQDMEDFLSDYGMVWVGGVQEDEPASARVDGLYQELEGEGSSEGSSSAGQGVWRPGTSLVSTEDCVPNFDLVLKNVAELNVLAREGEKKIQHTVSGARFKTVDHIPLTIYANGIFMFNGPFRPYEEPETQQCMQDLMDGFFPTELKTRYPDGVPIKVNDQRDVLFRDQRGREFFPGTGLTLGGDADKPSRLVPSNMDKATTMHSSGPPVSEDHTPLRIRETSKPPVEPLSVNQFLNKLHPAISKEGNVIDVRSSVADLFKEETIPSSVTVVDTPILQGIKERARSGRRGPDPAHSTTTTTTTTTTTPSRPSSASPRTQVTTLRVKTETGDHTFILKLSFTDTIADLRMHLDRQRKPTSPEYDLVTTFPNCVYIDDAATLEESGLTPNATILMRLKNR